MPKPPPRLTRGGGAPASSDSSRRQSEGRPLRLDQRGGIERLRAGEDVEAAPFGARRDDPADQSGHARGVDPERLGAAAHAHARALDLEIGIDPDGEPRRPAELRADREGALGLALGFAVERDAGLDRLLELDDRACRGRRS